MGRSRARGLRRRGRGRYLDILPMLCMKSVGFFLSFCGDPVLSVGELGGMDHVRRNTSTGTTARTLGSPVGDVQTIAQVREVRSIRNGLISDILHAGKLALSRPQCILDHLAQITGAAVRCVVWRRPEGDWLDGLGTHGEVLLDEKLVFTRIYLGSVNINHY